MISNRTSVFFLICFLFSTIVSIRAQQSEQKSILRPIQQNGKWGFIDKSGKVKIEPQFYWVEEFSEGLAAFEAEDGKHGYIDETGRIAVEPKFDRAEPFSEGLAPVAINFKWGFINKAGEIIIPLQYSYAHSFKDGIAPVELFLTKEEANTNIFNITAFINKTGKMILPPFKSLFNPRTSSGFLFVHHLYPIGESPNPVIMDKTGKVIIEVQEIDLDGFGDGLLAIKKNGKWGYINKSGEIVIAPQFEDARKFYEGLALVMVGEKWGFINTKGKFMIPAKFDIGWDDENHNFSEGLALVYLNDRCIYINQTGKTIFGVNCDDAGRFIGGIAQVKADSKTDNEKRGYIDKTGKFVWGPTEFKYKEIQAEIERNSAKQEKEENEKLVPLTEEEKKLDFRNLIADQPDFSAELTFFRSEILSGSGGAERIARKGDRYRRESQFWIFIGEKGKSRFRLFPATKTFQNETVEDEQLSYSSPFNPETLANDAETTFTPIGKTTIDGHECIKVNVQRKGGKFEKEKISLYLAKDLNYLVIIAQAQKLPFTFIQRLDSISLEVADSLVQIPPDYNPIYKKNEK